RPARRAVAAWIGIREYPAASITSRKFFSRASAPGSLPRRTLIATSHADAADTRISLDWFAMIEEARRLSDLGERTAQRRACVSRRAFNASPCGRLFSADPGRSREAVQLPAMAQRR